MTWDYDDQHERLAREVDAAIHWTDKHDGPIPDGVPFGQHQCPECWDILGLDGTASCSECGHIPEDHRA